MENSKIDLIAFMGQSNMAGRGTAKDAPKVPEGTAYEFRAVTDHKTVPSDGTFWER